jgi:hypothetical protein
MRIVSRLKERSRPFSLLEKSDMRSQLSTFEVHNWKLGAWNSELGVRNSECGAWNSELGAWNSELGVRNSELGAWNSNCKNMGSRILVGGGCAKA